MTKLTRSKPYDRSSTPGELKNLEDLIDIEALDREVADDALKGHSFAVTVILGALVIATVDPSRMKSRTLYDTLMELDARVSKSEKRLSAAGIREYKRLIRVFSEPLKNALGD